MKTLPRSTLGAPLTAQPPHGALRPRKTLEQSGQHGSLNLMRTFGSARRRCPRTWNALRTSLLPITLAWSLLGGLASAQVTRGYITIESRVGESQSAYVGTIAAVTNLDTAAIGRFELELTVDVSEVLKGDKTTTLRLGMKTVLPLECLEAYAKHQTRFLWFVMPKWPGGAAFDSWVVADDRSTSSLVWDWRRLGPEVSEHKGFSSQQDGINLFSMDFQVLDTPAKIVAVARGYAAAHPGLQESLGFDIPWSIAALCGPPSEIANQFYVPIVPELETGARNLLTNPKALLSRGAGGRLGVRPENADTYTENELATLRRSGIKALAHFKSSENTALLKRYRDDPSVRDNVYEVLVAWGVQVPKPAEEDKTPGKGTKP